MRITDFELQTQTGQLWLDIVERLNEKDAAHAIALAEKDAEISRLKGEPILEVPTPLISQLHEAFTSALTEDQQALFAAPYAIVRTLVQADQLTLAADYVRGIEVTADLETPKAGILALLIA